MTSLRQMTGTLGAIGAFAVSGLGLLGCGEENSGGPTKTLAIGTLIDRSGSNANPTWVSSADLAFKDMNAALKKTGHRNLQFEQAVGDSKSNAMVATTNAIELVKNRKALLLIGDNSLVDVAVNGLNYATDESKRLNVPVVCFACTSAAINNPTATDPNPELQAGKQDAMGWNYRVSMITALQAPVMVQLHMARANNGDVNGDGVFKIATYATSEPFGQSLAKAIRDAAVKLHPTALAIEEVWLDSTVDPNSYDWSTDLGKLTDNKNEAGGAADGVPDVIFNTVFLNFSIALTKAYAQNNHTIPVVAGDTFRRRTALDVLGAAANGQEGTSPLVADTTPSGQTFAREFLDATGLTPSGYDPQAYDAVLISLLGALVASQPLADPAQVTPVQIRDALKKVNDPAGEVVRPGPDELAKAIGFIAAGKAINYEGASGACDFDANRNTLGKIVHWKVENRAFVDYEQYDCSKGVDCPVVR
jgi:hypothetical protein